MYTPELSAQRLTASEVKAQVGSGVGRVGNWLLAQRLTASEVKAQVPEPTLLIS